MRKVIRFEGAQVMPEREALVSRATEGSEGKLKPGSLKALDDAMSELRKLAEPSGVYQVVDGPAFSDIYEGEGENSPENPLATIIPKAKQWAVFAITLGAEVSWAVDSSFEKHDYAKAYFLDMACSMAAERTADCLQSDYESNVSDDSGGQKTLRYSPGYCGWHLSGQKKLFSLLKPSDIGLSLTGSLLMQPLKSVSGVMISGPEDIHRFQPNYSFCPNCQTQSCLLRMGLNETKKE